jgi:hypothetical protein
MSKIQTNFRAQDMLGIEKAKAVKPVAKKEAPKVIEAEVVELKVDTVEIKNTVPTPKSFNNSNVKGNSKG